MPGMEAEGKSTPGQGIMLEFDWKGGGSDTSVYIRDNNKGKIYSGSIIMDQNQLPVL